MICKMNLLFNRNQIILFIILQGFYALVAQSQSYETNRNDSNNFLKTTILSDHTYEQSKEIVESKRESCIDEYQQHKSYRRNPILPSYCTQYCTETTDCQQENEQLACINPSYPPWPSRTLKLIKKVRRTCYVRITEILRYDDAEQLCQRHGLQMAIIDTIPLFEQLKQMDMFNTTCKGQCPETRGYYIGLRRYANENGTSSSQWVWSNNFTWVQNETDCDNDYSDTSYSNTTLLCYIGPDGEKKATIWNTGEPDNRRYGEFQKDEQCVEIIGRPDKTGSFEQVGKLNDISCVKPTLGVLCQMDDLKPINSTGFRSFANIIGFIIAENDTDDLWDNFIWNSKHSFGQNIEFLELITISLERLLILPSFTMEQAINVFDLVNKLINMTGTIDTDYDTLKNITNKLLNVLDIFPGKIQIDNNEPTILLKYDSMNISFININFEQWEKYYKENEWLSIIPDKSDGYSNTIIELNMPIVKAKIDSNSNFRLIEIVYFNLNLFPRMNKTNEIRNQIILMPISYQITNLTRIKSDRDLIKFHLQIDQSLEKHNMSCVYWSFEHDNGSWIADNGCRLIRYTNEYVQCSCNHLAHFALLLQSEEELDTVSDSHSEDLLLTFVSYIGISLSLFVLIIALITYALFRCSYTNRLHASLIMVCLSVLLAICFFIPLCLTKPNLFEIKLNYLCSIFGFLFHYFLLTSFMWMFILSSVQYMHFVHVFNIYVSHFFIKASITGWILPLVFPSLVLIIGKTDGYIGEFQCWISNEILRYATFIVPISIIILFTLILLLFTIASICRNNSTFNMHDYKRSKFEIIIAFCCFILMGVTWSFGILVLYEPIFLYELIFCISNAIQGIALLIFHVYLSKPRRELWKTFFIDRGFHQRRHHSFIVPTDPATITGSNTEVVTSLKRPIELRLTQKLTSDSTKENFGSTNPSFIDHNEDRTNRTTSTQSQPPMTQSIIKIQPSSLSDRIQKSKMNMNTYA